MMEVRCPACRSYDVALHEGRTYGRVRFKCRRCGLSFSFALTLPSYKENGKRLSAYEKALIRADHKLGATYSQIQAEYDITRRTVSQIIHGERDVRLLYVWRSFSYQRMWPRLRRLKYRLWGDRLRLLMLEELEKGFLRQGWGFPGMDLRNGEKAFSESWRRYNLRLNNDRIERFLSAVERALSESDWFSEILDEYEEDLDEEKLTRLRQALDTLRSLGRDLRPTTYRRGEDLTRVFNALKVMLAIRPGDYVLVPNLPHSKAFTLVEVVAGYDFQPIEVEDYEDFGHFVRVRKLGEFYVAFEDLESLREDFRREAQILYEYLSGDRLGAIRRRPIDVVDPRMKKIYECVERLVKMEGGT